MLEASVSGLFRTLLIIAGVYVILKFVGKILTAKREVEAEQKRQRNNKNYQQQKAKSAKEFGKTEVISKTERTKRNFDVEDVDFEEFD
ncbi:MAG: hypothetical protein ACI9XP_000963 [Lentimonas sp.]|jgi:hypothetical protein